nr:Ubiquitin carboxyl-terminal hydrolase 3 [Polyrhizophydium stewartii]
MDCVHFTREAFQPQAVEAGLAAQADPTDAACKACGEPTESKWACLACGEVNCGRYVCDEYVHAGEFELELDRLRARTTELLRGDSLPAGHTDVLQKYVLQPLFSPMTPQFVAPSNSTSTRVTRQTASKEVEISIWTEFASLVQEMWSTNALSVVPESFLKAVWKFVPSVTCAECSTLSTKSELFLDLSLSIPEKVQSDSNSGGCTLDAKPASITQFLTFHLKRFKFTRQSRAKIGTQVDFPLTGLDMAAYMSDADGKSFLYDLYGVIVHQGASGGSGHYISYIWSATNEAWFEMNDSRTRRTTPEAVLRQQAYMLFYVRRWRGSEPAGRAVSATPSPTAPLRIDTRVADPADDAGEDAGDACEASQDGHDAMRHRHE